MVNKHARINVMKGNIITLTLKNVKAVWIIAICVQMANNATNVLQVLHFYKVPQIQQIIVSHLVQLVLTALMILVWAVVQDVSSVQVLILVTNALHTQHLKTENANVSLTTKFLQNLLMAILNSHSLTWDGIKILSLKKTITVLMCSPLTKVATTMIYSVFHAQDKTFQLRQHSRQ